MTKTRIIAMVLAAAAGGSIAAVEGQPGAGSGSVDGGPNQGLVNVNTEAKLSPEEQQARAADISERGAATASRVQAMLADARRQKDVVRVNCLNDKLTQMNAVLRSLADRVTSMRNAATDDQRSHEFTVISVIGQRLSTLEQEASQCLGQDIYESTRATVVTTVAPGTPEGDVSTAPDSPDFQVPPLPPPMSPTL